MPEIVEVHTIAGALDKILSGRKLTAIKYDSKSKFSRHPIKKLDQLTLPCKIKSVTARGKKIIFTLDNGQFLVSSLGMEGRWVPKPENHSNLWIECEKFRFYYDDSRHFGDFSVALNQSELDEVMKTVGYCLLTQRDKITTEWWSKQFSNKRIKKPVCDFLLDQSRFSGIGNWVRAEVLYRAQINPYRKIYELSPEEVETLRQSTFNVIDEALSSYGLTLRTYKDPHGRTGTFKRACYKKENDPLGNPVQHDKVGADRIIHWVPAVQK